MPSRVHRIYIFLLLLFSTRFSVRRRRLPRERISRLLTLANVLIYVQHVVARAETRHRATSNQIIRSGRSRARRRQLLFETSIFYTRRPYTRETRDIIIMSETYCRYL